MARLRGTANREPAATIFEDTIAKKPPQCRVLTCTRDYRSARCCYFCHHKYACSWPCVNHPSDCGLLVIPRKRQKPQKGDAQDEDD